MGVYIPTIILVPMIGTQLSIILFSFLVVLISSISLLFVIRVSTIKKILNFFIVLTILFSITFFMNPPTFGEIAENAFDKTNVIYETETPYSYIFVDQNGKNTYLKGKITGSTWSLKIDDKHFTKTHFDYPLVAISMNENTENILILGLAGGTTSNSFTYAYPDVQVDGVEIDSTVIDIGKKYFNINKENLNPIVSDGRLYVKTTEKEYDIIFIDVYRDVYIPFHMVTIEFFKEIKDILKDDGVLCVNVVNYNQKTVDTIFNTVSKVFSSLYKLEPTYSGNYFLYGTNQKTDLNGIKKSILAARDNIPFSDEISINEKIELKLVFTDVYDKLEEYKKSDDLIYFTDDKVPLEYIVGMDVFPFN